MNESQLSGIISGKKVKAIRRDREDGEITISFEDGSYININALNDDYCRIEYTDTAAKWHDIEGD